MRLLSLNANTPSIKQGEFNSTSIAITVPEDMRAYNLFLVFMLPSGEKVFTSSILPDSKFMVTYALPAAVLSELGSVQVELQGFETVSYIKSVTYQFNVIKSLTGPTNGTGTELNQADYLPWYTEVAAAKGEVEAIAGEYKVAEALRISKEIARVAGESARIIAENNRNEAEEIRILNELNRVAFVKSVNDLLPNEAGNVTIEPVTTDLTAINGRVDALTTTLDTYHDNLIEVLAPSNNLLDAITIGGMLNSSTGAVYSAAGVYYSDYIPAAPLTPYTIANGLGSGGYGHVFYNASKVKIGGVASNLLGKQTITTPSLTAFIRVSGYTDYLIRQQVIQGTELEIPVLVQYDYKTDKYMGQTITTYGDSITWLDGKVRNSADKAEGTTAKGYQAYMREHLRCVIDNQGLNGATMTTISTAIKSKNFTGISAVTITGGVNNFRADMSLGTVVNSGFDNTTYAGAIQSAIEYILTNYPLTRIFLLSPIKGWDDVRGELPVSYSDIMRDIGKKYSIPVCDLYHLSGINNINKLTMIGDKDDSTKFPSIIFPSLTA